MYWRLGRGGFKVEVLRKLKSKLKNGSWPVFFGPRVRKSEESIKRPDSGVNLLIDSYNFWRSSSSFCFDRGSLE